MPVVLITASAVILLMFALSQAIMSMLAAVNYNYYTQLAEESAEAGTVYADACLESNDRKQTWGNTSTTFLTQSSDCAGTQNFYADSTINGVNASLPIRFTVGDVASTPLGVNIPAKGTSTMPGASTSITGALNRSITWENIIISQGSVSGTKRTCGIITGHVYCWGDNAYGQLGDGTTKAQLKPVRAEGALAGEKVTAMFAAQYHNCAVASGEVYCWGLNNHGQLGDNTTTDRLSPVKVAGPWAAGTVTDVGGTSFVSCAIAAGKIYCWGDNEQGMVGVNDSATPINDYRTPVLVKTAPTIPNGLSATYTATSLSSGSRSSNMCAVADSKAYCWGPNNIGQIGDNTTTQRYAPTAVYAAGALNGKLVKTISQDGYSSVAGSETKPPPYAHVCVVATDSTGLNGKAYCWGENVAGQLGNNSTTDSKVPVAVNTTTTGNPLSGKTIVDVVSGIWHSCALTSEGKVACWGDNTYGQLGDGTNADKLVPTAVKEESGKLLGATVTAIGGGANRGCAIANQKTYCWGYNLNGQIGDGTIVNTNVPTEAIFLRPKDNNYIY